MASFTKENILIIGNQTVEGTHWLPWYEKIQ